MASVKGMTTSTPEFHRVAKSAELEAEVKESVSEFAYKMAVSQSDWWDVYQTVADEFALCVGDCGCH